MDRASALKEKVMANRANPIVLAQKVYDDRKEAEHKAWKSLAAYKFEMFGYWCAIWVHANKSIGDSGGVREPNPWSDLVKIAKNCPKAKLAAKKVGL